MRTVVLSVVLLATSVLADISIEQGEFSADDRSISVRLSRTNAWLNERNHDGAWVFARIRPAGATWWSPVRIEAVRHSIRISWPHPPAALTVSEDRMGVFVAPGGGHRGPIRHAIDLTLDGEAFGTMLEDGVDVEVEVMAIEMVFVPEGSYWLGAADERGLAEFASFYEVVKGGRRVGAMHVESENPIEVNTDAGSLYYDHGEGSPARYQGDQLGPIPAEFPKGHAGFYIMKYEITQGEYATFLNHISPEESHFRAIHGGVEYAEHRGSISLVGGKYVAAHPERPANYISWDDGCAFADWAGLRPMTELEFTKACRGPDRPRGADYPWGTTDTSNLARVIPFGEFELVTTGAASESRLSNHTRDELGASYYWVFDLAGSVWERCVTIGHPTGRAFRGTHGDGRLLHGYATNDDWPRGDAFGGGYGYRGGGHYEADRVYEADGFNPHSPVAWRPFGSWGEAPRSKAYGFRCVRTAG